LTQGKEADKLQQKLEKVRQTIGQSEQDFRQFVRVLEGTSGKWEHEWKGFCDVSISYLALAAQWRQELTKTRLSRILKRTDWP